MIIFEIPVYSYTQEGVEKYWDEFYRKRVSVMGYSYEQENEIIDKLKSVGNDKCIWKYNEVVGYITINIEGRSIVAKLYKDKRRRIRIGGISNICLADFHLFRINIKRTYNSNQIMDMIKYEMDILKKEHHWLRKRYIDMESFYNICPYINWGQIFDL